MRKRAYFATVGLQKTTGRLALPRPQRGKTPPTEGKMSTRRCVYIAVPLKKLFYGRQKYERLRLTLHAGKMLPRRYAADLFTLLHRRTKTADYANKT